MTWSAIMTCGREGKGGGGISYKNRRNSWDSATVIQPIEPDGAPRLRARNGSADRGKKISPDVNGRIASFGFATRLIEPFALPRIPEFKRIYEETPAEKFTRNSSERRADTLASERDSKDHRWNDPATRAAPAVPILHPAHHSSGRRSNCGCSRDGSSRGRVDRDPREGITLAPRPATIDSSRRASTCRGRQSLRSFVDPLGDSSRATYGGATWWVSLDIVKREKERKKRKKEKKAEEEGEKRKVSSRDPAEGWMRNGGNARDSKTGGVPLPDARRDSPRIRIYTSAYTLVYRDRRRDVIWTDTVIFYDLLKITREIISL